MAFCFMGFFNVTLIEHVFFGYVAKKRQQFECILILDYFIRYAKLLAEKLVTR